MSESENTPRALPTGLLRHLLRAPIRLYRWRFGWLMGRRFLLLRHTGRRTGLQREAVVEVLRYDDRTDTYYIASGFGERADWFRNLMQKPEVTIQVANRISARRAERLPLPLAIAELERYGREHTRAARLLGRFLGLDWDGSAEKAAEIAQQIPIVALKPRLA